MTSYPRGPSFNPYDHRETDVADLLPFLPEDDRTALKWVASSFSFGLDSQRLAQIYRQFDAVDPKTEARVVYLSCKGTKADAGTPNFK
jgi:hypothetical protein